MPRMLDMQATLLLVLGGLWIVGLVLAELDDDQKFWDLRTPDDDDEPD